MSLTIEDVRQALEWSHFTHQRWKANLRDNDAIASGNWSVVWPDDVEEEEFDPDEALRYALSLRTRIDERLRRLSGPDAEALKGDLEELFGLVSRYLSAAGEKRLH